MSKNVALNKKDLMELAPSIFTKTKCDKVSDRYSQVNTIDVLDELSKKGWQPYEVSQTKSKYGGGIYSKHLIRLRNDEIGIGLDEIPEIVLTNSHDGRNAFKLHAGIFRLVCSNGLIIATQTFGSTRVRHQGFDMEDIIKVTESIVNDLPNVIQSVDKFKRIELSEDKKAEFVRRAIRIRWSEGNDFINTKDILSPERDEDAGNDLWTVYNVIQEKMIRGGVAYKLKSGRQQTSREITNIDRSVDINKRLWELTEEYSS